MIGGPDLSGIIGVFSKNNKEVSKYIYYGLYALQHRGQASAGISINNNGFIDYEKNLGLVGDVFTKEVMERLKGDIAIGQVRYASYSEKNTKSNSEPLVVGYRKGALSICMDGAIENYETLREKFEESGHIFQTDLSVEVIASLIAKYHKDSLTYAIKMALDEVNGSYSLIIMTKDSLIAARDPHGIRPLSIGKVGDDFIISSETCAIECIGGEFIRDCDPGEIVIIDDNGIRSEKLQSKKRALCIFELVYLARPDSYIDNRYVYTSRFNTGEILYTEYPTKADVVIGAPDSGTVAAIGYAKKSQIPYTEGIIKNRYIGRTFIEPTQDIREEGVRIKLNPLTSNIKGKDLILVDDSIVRGTTIKRTVEMLRKAGAKSVHVRIASPPVKHSCFLGVDTPNEENLIANYMTVEEIRKAINADSLYFISLEGLVKAAGGENGFCKGCFTGDYPVKRSKSS
ncbi:MAG: amidophosphoribosyltransferase [Tissierellales bacterium]|nr:amidophosphoribosyltransferase [Tissierellales bacterium]